MSADSAAARAVELLGRIPLFHGLPRSDLEGIAGLARPREAGGGEFLYREGDPGDRCFIVEDGTVELVRERPMGDHERLGVKRAGEAFGEISLLDDTPRSASARVLEDARLLSIARADFEALLGGDSLAVRLLRGMGGSMRGPDGGYAEGDGAREGDALRRFSRLVLHGLEPRAMPHVDGYRLAGGTVRDDDLGGSSLWDGFTRPDGEALLAVMDVEGTGLPPAYLLAIARALLRELGRAVDFPRIMARLNAATTANMFEGLDECVEASLIEVGQAGVRWACAGDQPAVILRSNGDTEDVTAHGPPLGIVPQFDYGVSSLELGRGDTLVALSEAPGGLVRGAIDFVRTRPDTEPRELARQLQTALRTIQSRTPDPDLSFIILRKG